MVAPLVPTRLLADSHRHWDLDGEEFGMLVADVSSATPSAIARWILSDLLPSARCSASQLDVAILRQASEDVCERRQESACPGEASLETETPEALGEDVARTSDQRSEKRGKKRKPNDSQTSDDLRHVYMDAIGSVIDREILHMHMSKTTVKELREAVMVMVGACQEVWKPRLFREVLGKMVADAVESRGDQNSQSQSGDSAQQNVLHTFAWVAHGITLQQHAVSAKERAPKALQDFQEAADMAGAVVQAMLGSVADIPLDQAPQCAAGGVKDLVVVGVGASDLAEMCADSSGRRAWGRSAKALGLKMGFDRFKQEVDQHVANEGEVDFGEAARVVLQISVEALLKSHAGSLQVLAKSDGKRGLKVVQERHVHALYHCTQGRFDETARLHYIAHEQPSTTMTRSLTPWITEVGSDSIPMSQLKAVCNPVQCTHAVWKTLANKWLALIRDMARWAVSHAKSDGREKVLPKDVIASLRNEALQYSGYTKLFG